MVCKSLHIRSASLWMDETDAPHRPTASCNKSKCYFAMDLPKKLAASMRVYNIAETEELNPTTAEWNMIGRCYWCKWQHRFSTCINRSKVKPQVYMLSLLVSVVDLMPQHHFSQKLQGKIINYMVLSLVGQHHLYT